MADPRQSTETKSKSIRSLSAPSYPVRNNRTCFLRKIFAVNNDDLSYLTRPPMGETNQTVTGQNKSAAKMSQKQVNLWFRERKYLMDKLDKSEDDVYQRLVAIQKTKMMIEKAREASPDRSSMALYMRKPSRAHAYRIDESELIKENPTEEDVVDGEKPAGTEETPAENSDNTENITQEKGSGRVSKTEKNENVRIKLDTTDNVHSPREIKAQNTARITDRPITQANMSRSATLEIPPQPDRSKTELGLVDETVPPPQTPAVKQTSQQPSPKTKPKRLHRRETRQSDAKLLPPKSDEPKTNAKRIEERILGEPFTYWTQNHRGKLVPSEVPYKRREFPLPDERDDEGRKRNLLESERKSKQTYMNRFSSLCDDLEKLEEWNPLDEIRAMAALRNKAKEDDKDADERWRKLGMLRHWVKAFGMREERELEGLDPNSEEALNKCKYLRPKEKSLDSKTKKSPKAKKKTTKSQDSTSKSMDSKAIDKNLSVKTNSWVQNKVENPFPPRVVQTGHETIEPKAGRRFTTQ